MNKLLLKVSLKYSAIYLGLAILLQLSSYSVFQSSNRLYFYTPYWFRVVTFIFVWILPIFLFALAHREFRKKKEGRFLYGEAFLIGLLIALPVATYALILYVIGISSKYSGLDFWEHLLIVMIPLLINIALLTIVTMFEGMWAVYEKAGKKGWEAFIPILNIISMLEIIKRPLWWVLMLFIPIVNLAFVYLICEQLAQRYGKEEGFVIGLMFLPFIFYPMIGLSEDKYIEELPEDKFSFKV